MEVAARLARTGRLANRVILIKAVAFFNRDQPNELDRRYLECRTLGDIGFATLWKLGGQDRAIFGILAKFLGLMRHLGLTEEADRIASALAGRARIRSWRRYQPSRYPGELHLLRGEKSAPDAKSDEGWSMLSERTCVNEFIPRTGTFLSIAESPNHSQRNRHTSRHR